MTVFEGSYREFRGWREAQAARAAELAQAARPVEKAKAAAQTSARKHGLNPFQLQRRIEAVEARIADLEGRIDTLHGEIEQASSAGDAGRVADLGAAYTQAEADLHEAMVEWETLVE